MSGRSERPAWLAVFVAALLACIAPISAQQCVPASTTEYAQLRPQIVAREVAVDNLQTQVNYLENLYNETAAYSSNVTLEVALYENRTHEGESVLNASIASLTARQIVVNESVNSLEARVNTIDANVTAEYDSVNNTLLVYEEQVNNISSRLDSILEQFAGPNVTLTAIEANYTIQAARLEALNSTLSARRKYYWMYDIMNCTVQNCSVCTNGSVHIECKDGLGTAHPLHVCSDDRELLPGVFRPYHADIDYDAHIFVTNLSDEEGNVCCGDYAGVYECAIS